MRFRFCLAAWLVTFLAITTRAQTAELDRALHDRYHGKTLLLRGFYSGDYLLYDSSGGLIGKGVVGDWTEDGFVALDDVHAAGPHLVIEGRRLLVTRLTPKFRFNGARKRWDDGKGTGPVLLKIDVDFGTSAPSVEQADAVISKVFLAGQDGLADLVPDYWKPCVPEGLLKKSKDCRFSDEFLAIPGVMLSKKSRDALAASGSGSESALSQMLSIGNGVSPPKAISSPEPEFSEGARGVKYQGTMTVSMVVSAEGKPTNVRVLTPLGAGLDAKAVHAVEGWKFEPARKDGQPVPIKIAVEVDFHLY